MKTHGDHEVEILDDHGQVIAVKPRKDIDKTRDILHVAYVFIITPEGKLILSRIPSDPAKGNLFPGKLAVTVATIVRHKEGHEVAAHRALKKELGVETDELIFLGETLESFQGTPKRLIAAYIATVAESDITPNPEDVEELVPVSKAELERLLERKSELAPTLLTLWDRYNDIIDG